MDDPQQPFYAHTPPKDDPTHWQTMQDHTDGVAQLAFEFAMPFGAQELARLAALLHDVGKYSDEFQEYLRLCHDATRGKGTKPRAGSAEHKCAGTKLALETFVSKNKPTEIGHILSSCVLGHHGGLHPLTDVKNTIAKIEEDAPGILTMETAIKRAKREYQQLKNLSLDSAVVPALAALPSPSKNYPRRLRAHEMLTRFIFSCLVDADSLDTERHFEQYKTNLRKSDALNGIASGWLKAVQRNQVKLRAKAKKNPLGPLSLNLRQVRRQVYKACLKAARETPRVFSLTVPTGGGKTLSALAFALAHAIAFKDSEDFFRTRIIYAAPFTSIIDQTAQTFRDVLGQDAVLEHHSAIESRLEKKESFGDDPSAQTEEGREFQRRLAAENWNVPLVVTTTVQLLESLFAKNTSRCRKLHNIARSIIILDEIQTLPPPLLIPLLSGLRTLVEQFGVTLVLCTATQPALGGDTPYLDEAEEGFEEIIPIISPDLCSEHFSMLKRVDYDVVEEKWNWARVADEMQSDPPRSCLAVLNTKKDALALLDALKGRSVLHLSTLLCGAHRKEVLAKVRAMLEAERDHDGPPALLVSTQVIEAGVDVDFPRVLRALGPLDRIIQSAGRCNREGLRLWEESKVVVFDPVDGGLPGKEYEMATAHAVAMMRAKGDAFDFNAPNIATAYFQRLYGSFGENGLDKYGVQKLREERDFPKVAEQVRLIKDDTVPVLVEFNDEAKTLLEEIWDRKKSKRGMTRELWRKIQPYTVAVYKTEVTSLSERTLLDVLIPDELYLWEGNYHPVTGIGGAVGHEIGELIISDRSRRTT